MGPGSTQLPRPKVYSIFDDRAILAFLFVLPSSTMAEQAPQPEKKEDVVRRFDSEKDGRIIKLLIGQGVMEGIAVSNQDCEYC